MTYNAAERSDVKAATKLAKLRETQRVDVIRGLMSSTPGRQWMHERLLRAHVFASSFTGEALSSAYREGERNIGLQDLNDIMSCCPDLYILMMQESNERDLANDGRTSAERSNSPNGDGGVEGPGDSGVERDDD